jgi:predicted anti-sigma-YlaC factor YlaD
MGEFVECVHSEQMTILMSSHLDGLLDADGQHRLQRHLAACPSCQLEWEAMQQVSALFEQSPMVGPPLGFAIRVERKLEDKVQKRRWTFGGMAVLTSSLPLAGMTVAAMALIVFGLVAWQWYGSVSSVQLGASAAFQIASGMGMMGKGASLFLKDLLVRYGPPLVLLLAVGLTLLAGMWTWLFVKRPGSSRHNGYT